jgi:hypothetical protein
MCGFVCLCFFAAFVFVHVCVSVCDGNRDGLVRLFLCVYIRAHNYTCQQLVVIALESWEDTTCIRMMVRWHAMLHNTAQLLHNTAGYLQDSAIHQTTKTLAHTTYTIQ